MTEFANLFVDGLVTGCVYALLAVGFTLVYNVSGVLALAQGAYVALAILAMTSFTGPLGVVGAVAATTAILVVVAGVVQWFVVRPAMKHLSHTNLLMLMGGLLIVSEGVAILVWGTQTFTMEPFNRGNFDIGGVVVPHQDIWVVGAALLCVGSIGFVLRRTTTGKALQATAQDSTAAGLMGIRVDRIMLVSACLAALLGVVAGIVIGPLTALAPNGGAQNYTLYGLIAVTVGGLGSIGGSLVGGFALGLAESLTVGYISPTFADPVAIGFLLVLLLFRPNGLVGRREAIRSDVAERKVGQNRIDRQLPPMVGRPLTIAGVVAIGVLPWLVGAGALSALTISGIYCIAVIGVDVVTGLAGQVNLGQTAFMIVGGYTAAVLMKSAGMSADLALLCGLAGAVLVSLVIGIGAFRLRGMYLATATLALGVLAFEVVSGLGITGGANGIAVPERLSIGGFAFDTSFRFYYLSWILAIAAAVIALRVKRSSGGLMMRVMNADEMGARSLGAHVRRMKILAFGISALFGGLAGALYGQYNLYLSPFSSVLSLSLITMVVVGGEGSVIGPMIAATLLTFLPLAVQGISTWFTLVDGALLVLFLRYLPGGLYGAAGAAIDRLGRAGQVDRRARTDGVDTGLGLMPAGLVAAESVVTGTDGKQLELPVHHLLAAEQAERLTLEVTSLSKRYGGVLAVHNVSFAARTAQIFAIIGPNGAGKSTLLNVVSSCERCDGGQVRLGDRPVSGSTPERMAELGVVRTFQQSRFFAQLSVLENVLVGGYSNRHPAMAAEVVSVATARAKRRQDMERAMGLLEIFGLSGSRDAPPSILPLAGQKGLDLARALMSDPEFLLLDEPGAGLNDAETEELGLVLSALRSLGKGIVFVDHNMGLVMSIADQVMVMDAGQEIFTGHPDAVRADSRVLAAYVGAVPDAVGKSDVMDEAAILEPPLGVERTMGAES